MKKIFQIYLADLKRISTNVVAIVIIMGLGIIQIGRASCRERV